MSRQEDLRSKAARIAAARAQAGTSSTAPADAAAPAESSAVSESVSTEISTSVPQVLASPVLTPAVRSKPVRLTVDVAPAEHQALKRLMLDSAVTLGVASVSGQELVAATVRRLLADPTLQQQVLSDVAEGRRRGRLR